MQPEFWRQRWHEDRIGFHQSRVSPLLDAHWPTLELPPASRVFVPLCGKSLDMPWLARRGHRVFGIELSELAIRQFFEEHALVPACRDSALGTHFVAGPYELVCGDAFALDREALADCAAVFDRAALIALPPELRRRYADTTYARLPDGCRGLAITLEYPQHEKNGPPFPVDAPEVHALFSPRWSIRTLERRNILADEPGFAADGVTALSTVAYRFDTKTA